MENASKALIIAGAILLSIVLITLGVVIIGRGQETVDQANIDDQVVSTWNQKWTKYEGKEVSGTTVNNLINELISSNGVATNNGEPEKVIRIQAADISGTADTSANKIVYTPGYPYYPADSKTLDSSGKKGTKQCTKYAKSNAKYTVSFKYNGFGYVSEVFIKANS